MLPLLSLVCLYTFVTSITATNAITMARAQALRNTIGYPIGVYEDQVLAERYLATIYLATPTSRTRAALVAQENKTSKAQALLQAAASSATVKSGTTPQVKSAIAILFKRIARLPMIRRQVGAVSITRSQVQGDYEPIVSASDSLVYETIVELPDAHFQVQAVNLFRIFQALDLLFQEQDLLVGDMAARSFPASAHRTLAVLVGERRGFIASALPNLDPVLQSYYRTYLGPVPTAALSALENSVIDTRADVLPRIRVQAYEKAALAVEQGINIASLKSETELVTYVRQTGVSIYLRLILAGGLGLLAIIVSAVVSVLIGRGLIRELGGLRSAALELADVRLPELVFRLSSGEDVGTDDEVPFPNLSHDEIGQVRQAFNSVQRTAIEAAVGQARLRAGIATIFRNLARRSQTLLHRQLAMLDDLEMRAAQPEELDSLFQIDHLTTRMRRHAEGLVVLAGERPGRGWKKPVPLADVLRAAVAEVEDYRRVRVITRSRAALAGRAVADVIHLIAELVENGTLFSPPNTPVRVIGDLVGRGFAVEIEDRGLGMTETAMAELNAKLADPPQVDLATTEQLGLYVTARLAREHGIRVTLRDSPFGGTAAVVLIPNDLVVSEETYAADSDTDPTNELAIQTSGRHAARSAVWDLPVLGGDAPAGSPGLVGPNNDAALPAMVPAPTGTAEPFLEPYLPAGPEAGEDLLRAETSHNGDKPVALETTDSENVQHDPGKPPYPSAADLTELGLPRRIRQASLAPELRDPQPPEPVGADGGVAGWRSPDETRDAFTALQRGWERGRAEPAAASDTGGAGSSDTGDGDGGGGGFQAPGAPEQEGAP
jgi:signal transduction histidine kinase